MTFSGFNLPKDLLPKDLLPKDIRQKVADHMGEDPSTLPILTEQFEKYNQPNLQIALDELTQQNGRSAAILGIQASFMNNITGTALKDLIAPQSVASFVGLGGAKEGSVQYVNVELDGGKKIACVQSALYLVRGEPKLAVLLRQHSMMDFTGASSIDLDIMAKDKASAENFIKAVRRAMAKHNVYRGKILSVTGQDTGSGFKMSGGLKFHTLPPITRDKIILPEGLLKRIERQTVDVGKYSEALKKAKRKLKRGILPHGKPGTGKTLTAMYLASEMKERTVLLLTGKEPALASRPGRVDQAYEIPLPDAECRKRLFDLYCQALAVQIKDMDALIKRTAGASGAFISELMRKAALFAAADSDPIVVEDRHVDEALHELVVVGGHLTKSLLGSRDIGFTPKAE